MEKNLQLFDHIFIDNKATKTLFLLHGTGGTKEDFLFLDEKLDKKYNIVGLQGNVNEQGMARFFKRLSHGVFDQENIKAETKKLSQFLQAWSEQQELSVEQTSFLGYSNGANMLLCMLFYFPELVKKVVLLHPMIPIKKSYPDLSDTNIFVSLGFSDPFLSSADQKILIETLHQTKAKLVIREYDSGHEITHAEIDDVITFLTTQT